MFNTNIKYLSILLIPLFAFLILSCEDQTQKNTTEEADVAEVSDLDINPKAKKENCDGVFKKKTENGKTTYSRVSCEGNCLKNNDKCDWRKSKDHNGIITEWCGCPTKKPGSEDFAEPDDYCYTALETEKDESQKIKCPDRKTDCGKNKYCDCEKKEEAKSGGTEVANYECKCLVKRSAEEGKRCD